MFKDKRRIIVKELVSYRNNKENSFASHPYGIPKCTFENHLKKKNIQGVEKRLKYWEKRKFKGAFDHITNSLDYLKYCIEDGYITNSNPQYLNLSSKGESFVKWNYPLIKFLNHWTIKNIITFLLGGIVGWMLNRLL